MLRKIGIICVFVLIVHWNVIVNWKVRSNVVSS